MRTVPDIEDLYDVPPIEIELVGGYFDGCRMFLPDDRDRWLMPLPLEVTLARVADPTLPDIDVQEYRWTGIIRDDGIRVFRAT